MIGLLASLIPGLFKIGDKLIVDKDKKAEYAFKVQEMLFRSMEVMLSTKTYPFVDALVKLSYASEQIIKGLFRPVVSAAMMGFEIYFAYKGIDIPDVLDITLTAAFPAWGASRYAEKQAKVKKKKYEIDFEDDYDN